MYNINNNQILSQSQIDKLIKSRDHLINLKQGQIDYLVNQLKQGLAFKF